MLNADFQPTLSMGDGACPSGLDRRIAEVGNSLARSFRSVLDGLPGAPHRPLDLARSFSLNKDVSSRLLKATSSLDPIAVTHLIPGPDPLRKLLRAAAKRKVNAVLIAQAEAAVREFERLIDEMAGDRSGLDAIISAWMPEVREKLELLSKQAVFKGMSHIRGVASEVGIVTQVLHPSAQPNRIDLAFASSSVGLRRLRPGARIACTIAHDPAHQQLLTLNGEPVEHGDGVVLEQFCSAPAPSFEVRREDTQTHYILTGDGVGLQQAINVTLAHVKRECLVRDRSASFFMTNDTPTRRTILDVLVHESLYAGVDPVPAVYDTTVRGVARYGDRNRELDLLDVQASIEPLGRGIAGCRVAEAPSYVEMLTHLCQKLDWKALEFRGYRCAIDYPVYGSELCMVFRLPRDLSS